MNKTPTDTGALLLPTDHSLTTSSATNEELMQLADELRHSSFAMPLSLLMTAHLPLRGLAVAAVDMFGPLLSLVLSKRTRTILSQAFEHPDQWQAFLDRLNQGSNT